MMIRLTAADTKRIFIINASLVMFASRATDNPLITMITTSMMTQKGPATFGVLEAPETVQELVNVALGKPEQVSLVRSH